MRHLLDEVRAAFSLRTYECPRGSLDSVRGSCPLPPDRGWMSAVAPTPPVVGATVMSRLVCAIRGDPGGLIADESGYDAGMSESSNENETPEVGLIPDEDLPEDLQPTDDNPLAKDPSDTDDDADSGEPTSDDLPDLGAPGPS